MLLHDCLILHLVALFWSADTLSLYKRGLPILSSGPNIQQAIDAGEVVWAVPNLNQSLDQGFRDLVFIHVPFNFGHTVEYMALFGAGPTSLIKFASVLIENTGSHSLAMKWNNVYRQLGNDRKNIEIWGAMNPVLLMESSIGCPLYLTPPKFWPKNIAQAYFGQKRRFGLLRDPYERLVAMFRGDAGGETGAGYGGDFDEYVPNCDVDGAIKAMMQGALYQNKYAHGCTFVPQYEYFEGDYGAEIAVDNRDFPFSLNRLFREHNYHNTMIEPHDCIHVSGCTETWTTALSDETKALVRQHYAKDFELICKVFGYCEENENTCLKYVPLMCPRNMSLVGDDKPGARPPIDLPIGQSIQQHTVQTVTLRTDSEQTMEPPEKASVPGESMIPKPKTQPSTQFSTAPPSTAAPPSMSPLQPSIQIQFTPPPDDAFPPGLPHIMSGLPQIMDGFE